MKVILWLVVLWDNKHIVLEILWDKKQHKLILYEKSIIPLATRYSSVYYAICLPFNPEKSEWENCELNDVNGGDKNNGGGFNLPLLLSMTGRNPPEFLLETTNR